jgi:hypothetical protein
VCAAGPSEPDEEKTNPKGKLYESFAKRGRTGELAPQFTTTAIASLFVATVTIASAHGNIALVGPRRQTKKKAEQAVAAVAFADQRVREMLHLAALQPSTPTARQQTVFATQNPLPQHLLLQNNPSARSVINPATTVADTTQQSSQPPGAPQQQPPQSAGCDVSPQDTVQREAYSVAAPGSTSGYNNGYGNASIHDYGHRNSNSYGYGRDHGFGYGYRDSHGLYQNHTPGDLRSVKDEGMQQAQQQMPVGALYHPVPTTSVDTCATSMNSATLMPTTISSHSQLPTVTVPAQHTRTARPPPPVLDSFCV